MITPLSFTTGKKNGLTNLRLSESVEPYNKHKNIDFSGGINDERRYMSPQSNIHGHSFIQDQIRSKVGSPKSVNMLGS